MLIIVPFGPDACSRRCSCARSLHSSAPYAALTACFLLHLTHHAVTRCCSRVLLLQERISGALVPEAEWLTSSVTDEALTTHQPLTSARGMPIDSQDLE